MQRFGQRATDIAQSADFGEGGGFGRQEQDA